MAKNLNWFEARRIARVEGRRIRREAWRKWLDYDRSVFLWHIYQPAGVVETVGGEANTLPESRHVARAEEFQSLEFFSEDWTDEHWDAPFYADSPAGGSSGGSSGGSDSPAGGSSGGSDSPAGGGGSDSGGGGSWSGGDVGGDVGGGGGGGGGQKPPKPPKPEMDYTPAVGLTLAGDPIDGPGCYIIAPEEGLAFVNVSIPNPQGGTVKVLMVSVTCLGKTRLLTMGPGTSAGFEFKGPINPGGTITATATASDGNGHTWTGADTDKWPELCLLPIFSWSGNRLIQNRCNHGSGPVDGFDQLEEYTKTAQYAVNPEPGAENVGVNTGADFNDGFKTTVTPYPDGLPTVTEWDFPAPEITCAVAEDGSISYVTPPWLDFFLPPPPPVTTGEPPEDCTLSTVSQNETGPNGSSL